MKKFEKSGNKQADSVGGEEPQNLGEVSRPAPLETEAGEQRDDNVDDLGNKAGGGRIDQPTGPLRASLVIHQPKFEKKEEPMTTYDPEKSTTEVRQGNRRKMNLRVLVVSSIVLVAIFAIALAVFSGSPSSVAQ